MSDEPQHTYTALEIVREFFPATSVRLLPRDHAYRLQRHDDGDVLVVDVAGRPVLRLTPLTAAHEGPALLCCDLCQQTSPRPELGVLRAEVPGSDGRRFRYLTACRDTDACDARRLDDVRVEALLRDD